MAHKLAFVFGVLAAATFLALRSGAQEPPVPVANYQSDPAILAQRGRYIIRTSGCNDCHTPGFMQKGEEVPESQWLTGTPIGWRGPWGTTYASNLRLFVKPFSADNFVKLARTRNSRPPMPWPSLHAMSDQDLRCVYHYIKSLGEAGETMPEFVPPGQEPTTPYFNFEPVIPAR